MNQKAIGAIMCLLISMSMNAQQKTTATLPPMGWNSWNHFAGRVTDADIRAAADALVSSGMKDAGYIYVNIDDTWEGKRDAKGIIHPNDKFPDMKALADYVHSKGLKIGIYSSPGPLTCAGYEGSYGREQQDADTYAAWGIDYLKYDLCGLRTVMKEKYPNDLAGQFRMMQEAYKQMHQAILKTGRPMVYSLCQYGYDSVWRWGASVGGNSWRTTEDIDDTWDRMSLIGFSQAGLERFAGSGHWNDPDMLEVGNGGMTTSEYQVHMSLWAMLSAPLLAGNDLSRMTEETKSILMNKAVIAIDQDVLGRQAVRVWSEGPLEIWVKELSGNKRAVALFNRGDSQMTLKVPAQALKDVPPGEFTELWTGRREELTAGKAFIIPTRAVVLLRN